MGGYGSSRWHRVTIKRTVEACYHLSVFDLRKAGLFERDQGKGRIEWENGNNIGISVDLPGRELRVTYAGTDERIDERWQLSTTTPNYGGLRYWFICHGCGGRVAKLHRPPGRLRFRCRGCWGLTYKSSQTSDKRISHLLKALRHGADMEEIISGYSLSGQWGVLFGLLDRIGV